MKAILEFDIPKDRTDHILAINGPKYFCALFDMQNEIRRLLKHSERTEEEFEIIDNFRKTFYEILNDNFIILDEIP